MKRTPLARKNLTDRPSRTVVSALGVGFAIVLMFMQLGFMGAVGDTSTNVYGRTQCDLVIRSPEYLQVFDPRSLESEILPIVTSIAEVAEVQLLDLGVTRWRNPKTGELRVVAMMGIEPENPAIQIQELEDLSATTSPSPTRTGGSRQSRRLWPHEWLDLWRRRYRDGNRDHRSACHHRRDVCHGYRPSGQRSDPG